ncbi:MAG: hypothetical protein DMD43_08770 [Gemmatimonadetes bacterium]|nr:MAG: hypothetical protein DMD43_08770 [Gemmatimonadota bacterium]
MRFSLLFYSSMLIIFLVTGTLLWTAASAVGAVHSVEKLVKDYFALASFQIEAWTLLKACFIGGLVLVLIGTGANVLLALIYNLTSDVVGGVEVTVLAEDTGRRRQVV